MKKRDSRVAMLVATAGVLWAIGGCGNSRAIVPTSYAPYNDKNAAFKIDCPSGWKWEGGGSPGHSWAKFTSGNAEISVRTSMVGSLIGDNAKLLQDEHGQVPDPSKEPVAVVHEAEKAGFEEEMGVEEKEVEIVKTGFTNGRRAEFTGKKTFGAPIHGYRATALGIDLRIRVVCSCPESEWAALKPAFEKVIESVAKGR